MPFHNELSNEIAIALMTTGDQSTADLKRLKDVVLTVHETLRQLEDDQRGVHVAVKKRPRRRMISVITVDLLATSKS